jgi:hypothetical protein
VIRSNAIAGIALNKKLSYASIVYPEDPAIGKEEIDTA